MRRLPANVERVVDGGHPVLHQVAGKAADDAADQHDQRNFVVMESDFFRQAFDGERTVGIDLLVTRLMRGARRIDQSLRRIEFGHDAVDGIAFHIANLAIIFTIAIILAITPSPRLRAEGCAFRRWKSQAECGGTGTSASGTCRWCRYKSSNPSAWGSTCPRRM